MLKILKSIFGSDAEEQTSRALDDVSQLRKGDFVKLNDSFGLPQELRGATLQVTKVSSYIYVESLLTELVMKGDGKKPIFMAVEDDDGELYLSLSRKLNKGQYKELFGADFKSRFSSTQQIKTLNVPEELNGWVTNSYDIKEQGAEGRFFERDLRDKDLPGGGEHFTYYEFYDDNENFAVEIEVWDESEIDIMVTLIRPISDVAEFWPG